VWRCSCGTSQVGDGHAACVAPSVAAPALRRRAGSCVHGDTVTGADGCLTLRVVVSGQDRFGGIYRVSPCRTPGVHSQVLTGVLCRLFAGVLQGRLWSPACI
jgi:hypothetical protein